MEKLTATNYVDIAESVINSLKTDKEVTTSQLRNLLSLVNNLYSEVVHSRSEKLSESIQGKVQYLRLRFVYAAGKDNKVKDFLEKANIIPYLKAIGDNKESLLLFCKYMEALVAYHKYYGGRD